MIADYNTNVTLIDLEIKLDIFVDFKTTYGIKYIVKLLCEYSENCL